MLQAGMLLWLAIRALLAASLALGSLVMAAGAVAGIASAQGFVAQAIAEAEIEQRLQLARLQGRREPSRADVIADLRAEKQRLLAAQLAAIEVTDSDVDAAYASMAKRTKLSPEQFTAALAERGINATTLKRRIRADLAWLQYRHTKKAPDIRSWQE